MTWLSGLFGAISSVFNWVTGRSAIANTKPMQAAQTAQKQNDSDNEISQNVQGNHTDRLRSDIAP